VFDARRVAVLLASELGFDERQAGRVALVVTEAGTNLVKHARSGEIHLSVVSQSQVAGIEVIALDRGPGMADLQACLRDGYSTRGTAGTGLGAIARIADQFDAYSQPGKGTAIVARVFSSKTSSLLQSVEFSVGAVQVPVRGEIECGDNWGCRVEQERAILLLADGLGHGPDAAEASRAAVAILHSATDLHPVPLLEQVHRALRHTRGAAVAIAALDPNQQELRFAGVGNISTLLIGPVVLQHLVSHNGTAGHNVRKFQEFVYPFRGPELLLMHSDGITTSWRMESFPDLIQHHPSLIAATLFREAARGHDDACVVVVRVSKYL